MASFITMSDFHEKEDPLVNENNEHTAEDSSRPDLRRSCDEHVDNPAVEGRDPSENFIHNENVNADPRLVPLLVQVDETPGGTRGEIVSLNHDEPSTPDHSGLEPDSSHPHAETAATGEPKSIDSKGSVVHDNNDIKHLPTESASANIPSNPIPIQDSKGAKILLSRFSSWRRKANEAVVQNVQAFSQTELAHQLKSKAEEVKSRAEVAFRSTTVEASGGKTSSQETPSSAMNEGELLLPKDDSMETPIHVGSHDDTGMPQSSTIARIPLCDSDLGHSSDNSSFESDHSSEESLDRNDDVPDKNKYVSPDMTMSAAAAALYVRSAASVISDSVSSGFKGRYGEESNPVQPPMKKPSQTSKILSSRAAEHMQAIIDTLDDSHEYVMLLGQGMLGVNLRQTFLKSRGVYVDFLVEGGAAYNSRVVYPGDVLQKVGKISVAKGTILNVPKLIADAKRPVFLVFSTGQKVETSKVNFIDLAIAMMHQIKEDEFSRGILRMPLSHSKTSAQAPTKMDAVLRSPDSLSTSKDPQLLELGSENNGGEIDGQLSQHDLTQPWSIPLHHLDAVNPANVPHPPRAAKDALAAHLCKRGNGAFEFSMMTKAAATTGMDNFRGALRYAFIICALDGRRLPFLSRHFATINPNSEDGIVKLQNEDSQLVNASVELMLFLELAAFVELYGSTPKSRRLDIAKRIAFKFFLPSKIGNRLERPMFDFAHLVSDNDLKKLHDLLLNPEVNSDSPLVNRGIFLPFQEAVIERLHGPPFISFLMSDECARMRAYLRDTAPYKTVSPGDIFFHVVASEGDEHALNHLLYNVLYLLCQRERETCGENDDIVGDKAPRVVGAAGGVCCAIFIKKTLLRMIDMTDVDLDNDGSLINQLFQELKKAFEQLWEIFLFPNGGALELLSHSNETEDELSNVRNLLSAAADQKNQDDALWLLTNVDMSMALTNLADDLIYDYSVNDYSKFREHQFHEWMCGEVSRASGDVSNDARIPRLSKGCISRLLRNAELPKGLSSHKPPKDYVENAGNKNTPSSLLSESTSSPASRSVTTSYPYAHYAIVYGADDGRGKIERSANPTLSELDVRRYTCQNVLLDFDDSNHAVKQCRVPPTIESYAVMPLPRKSHFSQVENAGRLSADGWVVSLFDFMIPGPDTENTLDGSTFGVSLLFQQDENVFMNATQATERSLTPLKLVFEESPTKTSEESAAEKGENSEPQSDRGPSEDTSDIELFSSPINLIRPMPPSELPLSQISKEFRVAANYPIFNERLTELSWIERVKKRRMAIPMRAPVSIGVILVSSQNTILAMRESLSKLLVDFSRASGGGEGNGSYLCTFLIDVLGNYAHSDVEHGSLRCFLEPYLRFGSSPWLSQPIRRQDDEFLIQSGQRLIESLPLVPLALLYVSVLLEQKVVFSSSRRGILLSAVTAITKLLHPLRWEHLVVPLVPSSLATDLLEYPAPFIIGLAADDQGNIELLNSLPDDVTLVDLDVGRVILAPSISFEETTSTTDVSAKMRSKSIALRSQVLYLAQELGVIFGSRLHRRAWCGDSPLSCLSRQGENPVAGSFIELQSICESFLTELLASAESCCYWIEEKQNFDSTEVKVDLERCVIFDEDRFFQIKNLRATRRFAPLFADNLGVGEFALNVDDFDLILECFLRCQSMSTYISCRRKNSIAFS